MTRPATTTLDDLLTHDAAGHRTGSSSTRAWWVKAVLGAAVLAGALVLALYLIGFWLPYPVALAGILALFGLYRAVSGLGVTPVPRLGGTPAPVREQLGPDQLADAVGAWQTRLSWGRAGIRPYNEMSSQLAELVEERLRLRHGVTMASDPARARSLVGDQAWKYLANPAAPVPSPRDLPGLLTEVEKL